MLSEMLRDKINVIEEAASWEEAIRIASAPLIDNQFINAGYITAMVDNVKKNGPYIIILPGIAIPHSQSRAGVLKTGMAVLKVNKGVIFPENKPVRLLVVLAAADENTHLEMISELTDILIDDQVLEQIMCSETEAELRECLL